MVPVLAQDITRHPLPGRRTLRFLTAAIVIAAAFGAIGVVAIGVVTAPRRQQALQPGPAHRGLERLQHFPARLAVRAVMFALLAAVAGMPLCRAVAVTALFTASLSVPPLSRVPVAVVAFVAGPIAIPIAAAVGRRPVGPGRLLRAGPRRRKRAEGEDENAPHCRLRMAAARAAG